METTKKYYWIKLKTNFFESETISYLLSLENGSDYVIIYQKLCLLAANKNGELVYKFNDKYCPFDFDTIVRETKYFEEEIVDKAMETFIEIGLITLNDNDVFEIADYDSMVGYETEYAEKQRKYREKKNDTS